MPEITFDRPDADKIKVIKAPSGRILSATVTDHSPFAYLLKLQIADHGHERTCSTYEDWQSAYMSTRGFKLMRYGEVSREAGDAVDDKATNYLRLIRLLGLTRHKQLDAILNRESSVCKRLVFEQRYALVALLDNVGLLIKDVQGQGKNNRDTAN